MRLIAGAIWVSVLLAKEPIKHEDVWLMKRVGAPAVSPDGKWAVFSVTEPAYDPKNQVSDLWLVPTDGSAQPRRLTYTKGSESGASWSHDGKRIAFAAKRDGEEDAQIYVLRLDGGEAQPVTKRAGGASSAKFSPDGKSILFESDFDPIAAQRKERKYNARVYETFPIRYWDRWLDEKRPHLFVQRLEPGAEAKDLLAGTALVAEPGFDGASGNSGSSLDAVWSPDGASIMFNATTNRTESAFNDVVMRLWQVPVNGGEPKAITQGPDSYSGPVFSPDGRTLFASHEPSSRNDVYHVTRVAALSWPNPGQPRVVTAKLDRSVSSFGVSPDGSTLYALAEEHGHEKLFSVPAAGGDARLVYELDAGCYANLQVAAKSPAPVLIANWESSTNPLEVVRLDPASRKHTALSGFSAERASGIDWQPIRHFWFTARNGRKIHNMMVLPPAFDPGRKYPLVVFIHGGPHTMSRDQFHTRWNYHMLSAPGYVVLTTNYTGSTGFGEKFAQAIQGDPLKGPGDEINEAVDEALKQFPFIDGSRMAAGGASYGGHLANWLEATTTRFKCLYSHAGLINLESQWGTSDVIYHREVNNGGPVWEQGKVWREQNPIRKAAHFQTPILLTVGERDYRVPLNQTIEHWSVLQRRRVPSKLIVFPEENHWILKGENNRFFFQELHGWLAMYLR